MVAQETDVRVHPGSRWRLIRGQHSGTVVEVDGLTWGGKVQYRNLGGGRSVGSDGWRDDDARKHTMPRDQFLTLYEPVRQSADSGGFNGRVQTQPRFRQINPKKERVEEGQAAFPEPQGIQVGIETITPALARDWLERGGVNRHMSEGRVAKLAAALRRGEWQLTGDSIKLDAFGCVRDGQHRLSAIIESGVTIQTLVVRNVEERAFDVMDTGKTRTVADVLSIHGYKSVFGFQACIRNLMILEATGRLIESTRESRELINTVTALEYAQKHPEVVEGVRLGDTVRLVVAGGHGLWAAMLTLCLRVDHDATYVFQDKLVNGEGLSKGDPILILRNRMLQEQRQYFTRGAAEKEELGATIINAWNTWRKDETVESWRRLVWSRRDPFPKAE